MDAIVPYLNFDGNATEALAFYSKVFNGKILFQQSFANGPMEVPADYKDKIMHATFQAGELTLMVSDCPPGYTMSRGDNMFLSLNFKSVDDINNTFKGLQDGATVRMPLEDTFWGARFGMLTDKFGINWMFNHDYPKDSK